MFYHRRGQPLAQQKRCPQVNSQRGVPGSHGLFQRRPGEDHTCHMDQDSDRRMDRQRLPGQGVHVVYLFQVGVEACRVLAQGLYLGSYGCQVIRGIRFMAPCQDEVGPMARQMKGHFTTNTPAGSGDECPLAGERKIETCLHPTCLS